MSNVVPRSDPLTTSEITMVDNLFALGTTPAGQAITKTGATTFANVAVTAGSITILITPGTIDDSNKTFTFSGVPSLVNVNGSFYQPTGGAITWTLSGTSTVTLSSVVGTGGSIFAI